MEQISSVTRVRRPGIPRVTASQAVARKDGLYLVTNDGRYLIPWEECSTTLANAKRYERERLRLLPAGVGVHWPLLDEDLEVETLVEGRKQEN